MIKKIMNELTEQYNEKFECEIFPDRYEFYSESHLYVYYRKSGKLVKNFQDRTDVLYRLKGCDNMTDIKMIELQSKIQELLVKKYDIPYDISDEISSDIIELLDDEN